MAHEVKVSRIFVWQKEKWKKAKKPRPTSETMSRQEMHVELHNLRS